MEMCGGAHKLKSFQTRRILNYKAFDVSQSGLQVLLHPYSIFKVLSTVYTVKVQSII